MKLRDIKLGHHYWVLMKTEVLKPNGGESDLQFTLALATVSAVGVSLNDAGEREAFARVNNQDVKVEFVHEGYEAALNFALQVYESDHVKTPVAQAQ